MIKKIFRSKFGKSILLVTGGTTFAQGLNILVSPIITRLFTPEEYGLLTVFTAILGVLAFGAFKYELSIPIIKDDKKAINALTLSFFILSIFVIMLLLVLTFFGGPIMTIFNSDVLYEYRFLIPLGVLLAGVYTILTQLAFRYRDYKNISKTIVNQSVFSNIIKISTGLLGIGALGLIIGKVVGVSAGIRVLAKPLFIHYKEFYSMISIKEMVWCFKRYKDFPLYNAPSAFLMSLGGSLPIIFFTAIFGSAVVGLYGLAYTIVKLPMNLLGKAVADVFFAEAANIGNSDPKRIQHLTNKLTQKLILVGLLPLIILLFFGPILFSLVFGDEWYTSGEYASIISVMIFFMLIFSPSGKIFIVFEKQRIRMLLDISRIFLISIGFVIAWFFDLNSYITITIYTVAMSISYIFMYVVSKRILKEKVNAFDIKKN